MIFQCWQQAKPNIATGHVWPAGLPVHRKNCPGATGARPRRAGWEGEDPASLTGEPWDLRQLAAPWSDEEKSTERRAGGLSHGSKCGLQGAQIRIKDAITQVAQEGKDLLARFQGREPGAVVGVWWSHIQREEKAAVEPT